MRADSDTSGRIQPMPSEGRQSWHYDTPTSLASYYRTKALPSDYGPDGLLVQCWSKGNAAASAGAAGPFYRTTGRRKQRVAAAELSVPQDLSKDHGPTGGSERSRRLCRGRSIIQGTTGRDGSAGRLCRSAPQQVDDTTTRPSGSGPTSQSDARDFGPKLLHADRPTGRGPSSQITSD